MDEVKLHEFMGKLIGDMGGAAIMANVILGEELGLFTLPEEQAMALANEDSPVYVAGGAVVLASMYLDKDKLVAAMRGNGALSWADHHPCLFSGTERFFRLWSVRCCRHSTAWCPGSSKAPRSPMSAAAMAHRR